MGIIIGNFIKILYLKSSEMTSSGFFPESGFEKGKIGDKKRRKKNCHCERPEEAKQSRGK